MGVDAIFCVIVPWPDDASRKGPEMAERLRQWHEACAGVGARFECVPYHEYGDGGVLAVEFDEALLVWHTGRQYAPSSRLGSLDDARFYVFDAWPALRSTFSFPAIIMYGPDNGVATQCDPEWAESLLRNALDLSRREEELRARREEVSRAPPTSVLSQAWGWLLSFL